MILGTLAASLAAPVQGLAARAHTWSTDSQQVARRNAMVANTALAARRRDREDVEGFFADLAAPIAAAPPTEQRAVRR